MKILKVDKDKVQVELTKEEISILVHPTFTALREMDRNSAIKNHKKAVELYDSVINALEEAISKMQ